MAFDAFLKLDGIPGDSTDATHKGEIDVMSFSWGESQPIATHGAGGGGGAGKVSFQDLHIGKSTVGNRVEEAQLLREGEDDH